MNRLQKIFSLTSWSLWLLRDLVALFLYATWENLFVYPFIPGFLKWIIPSLNLVRTIASFKVFSQNKNRMANSVDPDETAHYEPSHQDLHCLQKLFWSAGFKVFIDVQMCKVISNVLPWSGQYLIGAEIQMSRAKRLQSDRKRFAQDHCTW